MSYEAIQVAIDTIHWENRQRAYQEERGQRLAESIDQLGLLHPISIVSNGEGWRLAAGLHRLNACKLLGWAEIPAHPIVNDPLVAELVEIDENLTQLGLTVLEEAQQFQRRMEILREMGLLRQRGGNGANQYESNSTNLVELLSPAKTRPEIARELGRSTTALGRRAQIATHIPDEIQAEIAQAPKLADNETQLLEIARLGKDTAEQRAVVDLMVTHERETGEAVSVAEAKSYLTAPPPGEATFREVKHEISAAVKAEQGPQRLDKLLYDLDVAMRSEIAWYVGDPSAEKRRERLDRIAAALTWLEQVQRALQIAGRKLERVQ